MNQTVGAGIAATLAGIMPYSVLVTNTGNQALAGIDIRFTFNSPGSAPTRNFFYNSFNNPNQPILAQLQNGGGAHALLASEESIIQQLAANASLTVSIDLAIAADGRMAGPDLAFTVKKLTRQRDAYSDMRAAFLKMSQAGSSDAMIGAWLAPLSQQKVYRDSETGWGDRYVENQVRLAQQWAAELQSGQRASLTTRLTTFTPETRFPVVTKLVGGLE